MSDTCKCEGHGKAVKTTTRKKRSAGTKPSAKQLEARKRFLEMVSKAREYRREHPNVPFQQAMKAVSGK